MCRSLSIDQTYALVNTARRKSTSKATKRDLRLQVSHTNFLTALLQDVEQYEEAVRLSPPPSPPTKAQDSGDDYVGRVRRYDEYGFELDEDDGEEDLGGLGLCRVESRSETRSR